MKSKNKCIFHILIHIADKKAPLANVGDSSSTTPGSRERKPRSGRKVMR